MKKFVFPKKISAAVLVLFVIIFSGCGDDPDESSVASQNLNSTSVIQVDVTGIITIPGIGISSKAIARSFNKHWAAGLRSGLDGDSLALYAVLLVVFDITEKPNWFFYTRGSQDRDFELRHYSIAGVYDKKGTLIADSAFLEDEEVLKQRAAISVISKYAYRDAYRELAPFREILSAKEIKKATEKLYPVILAGYKKQMVVKKIERKVKVYYPPYLVNKENLVYGKEANILSAYIDDNSSRFAMLQVNGEIPEKARSINWNLTDYREEGIEKVFTASYNITKNYTDLSKVKLPDNIYLTASKNSINVVSSDEVKEKELSAFEKFEFENSEDLLKADKNSIVFDSSGRFLGFAAMDGLYYDREKEELLKSGSDMNFSSSAIMGEVLYEQGKMPFYIYYFKLIIILSAVFFAAVLCVITFILIKRKKSAKVVSGLVQKKEPEQVPATVLSSSSVQQTIVGAKKKVCPDCGIENELSDYFCHACGYKLS